MLTMHPGRHARGCNVVPSSLRPAPLSWTKVTSSSFGCEQCYQNLSRPGDRIPPMPFFITAEQAGGWSSSRNHQTRPTAGHAWGNQHSFRGWDAGTGAAAVNHSALHQGHQRFSRRRLKVRQDLMIRMGPGRQKGCVAARDRF